MISKAGIKSVIKAALKDNPSASGCHGDLSNAINGYLNANLTVKGKYTGTVTTPSGPIPDSNNAIPYFVWKMKGCLLNGPEMLASAKTGIPGWVGYMKATLSATLLSMPTDMSSVITVPGIKITTLPIEGNFEDCRSFDDTCTKLASMIYSGIKGASGTNVPLPLALSTASGVGAVTIMGFE